MNGGSKEYTPIRVALCKIELAGAILVISGDGQGDIEDYVLQKEDDC